MAENTQWRHARWFEPHPAAPEKVERRRAHPEYDTAACTTCGEILLPVAETTEPHLDQRPRPDRYGNIR